MRLLLKNLLFTLVVPGTVAGIVPWRLADGPPAGGALRLAAAATLFAAGGLVYAWCVWDFAAYGRGTPAPIDAPKKLVARGLYRWVRNPMYGGVLCVLAGWAVLFDSARLLVYAALVATSFHLFAVLHEEPHLEREFGEDYARYRARVGRWLPRWPRKGGNGGNEPREDAR